MTLRIESWGMEWRATLYGPGLPVIEPGPPRPTDLRLHKSLKRLIHYHKTGRVLFTPPEAK